MSTLLLVIMPPNPLNILLPPLKQLKARPQDMLCKWVSTLKLVTPNRRRILKTENVKPLYVENVREGYPKDGPRADSLIREANSSTAEPIWDDLNKFAYSGLDIPDPEHICLLRLSSEESWRPLDYATYVKKLEEENQDQGQPVNKAVVKQLLRKQLMENAGSRVKTMEDRATQLLKSEKDYWKARRNE